MTDAPLQPPRISSPAPVTGDGNRSSSSPVEHDSDIAPVQFASENANEERSGDPERRASNKQKRKRTSPTDQAILEAEYKLNPKPNKVARAVIVERVELNEKEVQIWFQNRRQINRRKSRPLLPHEIMAFGLGGMAALSSDAASEGVFSGSQDSEEPANASQEEEMISSRGAETIVSDVKEETSVLTQQPLEERVEMSEEKSADPIDSSNPSLPESQSLVGTASTQASSFPTAEGVLKSFSSTPGYLANRWNPPNSSFCTPSSASIAPLITPPIGNLEPPSSCPERINLERQNSVSAKVRLSMSLDGKAELISSGPSPSREDLVRPSSSSPILPQPRMRGLQRSYSALPLGPLPGLPLMTGTTVPRLPRGRSRDARTWEFYCDSEARDELTTQAENEANGSAVAAISLLRSNSNSALKPNTNKRNASNARRESSNRGKRPKLVKPTSTLARLQSGKPVSRPRSSKGKEEILRSPSGESDKENWIPEEGGNLRRRPLPSARTDRHPSSKPVLRDNFNILTHAVDFGGAKNKRRKTAQVEPKIFEDQENGEVSEDVEKFMRGEVSPSKKGDLDCIQGLLSLSQGNWR